MRVVSKFAIAFLIVSCVFLGLSSYLLAERDATRLERDTQNNLHDIGLTLRGVVEETWRARGLDEARAIFVRGDSGTPAITKELHVFLDVEASSERTAPKANARLVEVRIPVHGPDGRAATLRLDKSVPTGAALFHDDLGTELIIALALALAMAVIATSLGAFVIGRPLGRIAAQARRIGEGDLTQRLRSTGTDEIGVLKREINAMCDRLVAAYQRLEEEAAARVETQEQLRHLDRLRTVGTIASSMAHELGTPLNVLLLRGQSLVSGEIDASEIEASGRAVVTQVEKMSAIVRRLLDFSRRPIQLGTLASGQTPLGESADLVEVARHACRLLEGVARRHKIRLDIDTAHPTVLVSGSFELLEQALTNLIVNAIQSMEQGATRSQRDVGAEGGVIRIVIDYERSEASPVGEGAPRFATMAVIDEGKGMTDEVLKHVFEPFFTTKTAGVGTGLGLHVVRGIADDFGGSVSATSVVGQGSTFTLRLKPAEVS